MTQLLKRAICQAVLKDYCVAAEVKVDLPCAVHPLGLVVKQIWVCLSHSSDGILLDSIVRIGQLPQRCRPGSPDSWPLT